MQDFESASRWVREESHRNQLMFKSFRIICNATLFGLEEACWHQLYVFFLLIESHRFETNIFDLSAGILSSLSHQSCLRRIWTRNLSSQSRFRYNDIDEVHECSTKFININLRIFFYAMKLLIYTCTCMANTVEWLHIHSFREREIKRNVIFVAV